MRARWGRVAVELDALSSTKAGPNFPFQMKVERLSTFGAFAVKHCWRNASNTGHPAGPPDKDSSSWDEILTGLLTLYFEPAAFCSEATGVSLVWSLVI